MFIYNHIINAVSTEFKSTRQRNSVKVKSKIISFYFKSYMSTIKIKKKFESVDFSKINLPF